MKIEIIDEKANWNIGKGIFLNFSQLFYNSWQRILTESPYEVWWSFHEVWRSPYQALWPHYDTLKFGSPTMWFFDHPMKFGVFTLWSLVFVLWILSVISCRLVWWSHHDVWWLYFCRLVYTLRSLTVTLWSLRSLNEVHLMKFGGQPIKFKLTLWMMMILWTQNEV